MSIEWMSRVWDHARDVKGTSLLVLLCVADHANAEGVAFPSVKRIAERCRIGERATFYALEKLEQRDYLVRTPRPGHSTLYRVQIPALTETAPCTTVQQAAHDGAPITIKEPSSSDVGVVEVSPEETAPPTPTEVSTVEPAENLYCQGCDHPWGYHDAERGCTMPLDASGIPVSRTTQSVGPCACRATDPQSSTVEHPFPTFAKAALADHTTAEKNDWIAAWETVDSIAKAWEPTMHLTKYLADRKRNQRRPIAEEWVKWFVQDEHQAQADAAASVEDERDSRPWYE